MGNLAGTHAREPVDVRGRLAGGAELTIENPYIKPVHRGAQFFPSPPA